MSLGNLELMLPEVLLTLDLMLPEALFKFLANPSASLIRLANIDVRV